MYKLKDAVRRGSALLGAAGLLAGVGASAIPALVPATASADALNPLTQRSLTLSSSSPGWSYVDGSGNSTYAPPNSGANGQKTGDYYSFKPSTTGSINALTFQYCTLAAGNCTSPGNDLHGNGTGTVTTSSGSPLVVGVGTAFRTEEPAGSIIKTAGGNVYTVLSVQDDNNLTLTANVTSAESGVAFTYRGADSVASTKSDLNVHTSTPTEISSGDWTTINGGTNDPLPHGIPNANDSQGNFVVLIDNGSGLTYSSGWTMTATNQEEGASISAGTRTGKTNMITLENVSNSGNGVTFTSADKVAVFFFGTNGNYITNPGKDAFFVKINDYEAPPQGSGPFTLLDADVNPTTSTHIVDGGVTVANVMNESIEIQTKVLETMQFSVGTVDPDTLTTAELTTSGFGPTEHGSCDNILPAKTTAETHDVLYLGDPNDEHSLSTSNTYGTHSYWRLSSNSSAGASVYYAGATLHDTEGDDINPIGTTADPPQIGSEQFGLAMDNDANTQDMTFTGQTPNGDNDHFGVNHDNGENTDVSSNSYDYGEDNGTTKNGALDDSSAAGHTWLDHGVVALDGHNPQLYPLAAQAPYDLGGYQSGAPTGPPDDNASVFNPALVGANSNGTYAYNITTPPKFAFDPNANTVPALLASESNQVVDCVTGKMRYIANIAAITPAGIYTTKINYIAAPQY